MLAQQSLEEKNWVRSKRAPSPIPYFSVAAVAPSSSVFQVGKRRERRKKAGAEWTGGKKERKKERENEAVKLEIFHRTLSVQSELVFEVCLKYIS